MLIGEEFEPRRRRDAEKRKARIRPLFITTILVLTASSKACPMCKDSVVDSASSTNPAAVSDSTGLDFNKSIYIMLGGFAGVVGFTARVMYGVVKSSDESSRL